MFRWVMKRGPKNDGERKWGSEKEKEEMEEEKQLTVSQILCLWKQGCISSVVISYRFIVLPKRKNLKE